MEDQAKRILVVMDACEENLRTFESAVRLAVREHAELIGMFLIDINLFRMAQLPFVREIRFPSATESELDAQRLEREIRVRAERAMHDFAEIAEQARIRWSFRSVRGHVPTELASAASTVNILILGGRALRSRETEIRKCLAENRSITLLLL